MDKGDWIQLLILGAILIIFIFILYSFIVFSWWISLLEAIIFIVLLYFVNKRIKL